MNVSTHHLAEMLSLAMTIPTVVLAIAVVYLWLPAARVAAKEDTRDAHQWFILGVVAGFVGAALDNAYWFLPWSASYMGEVEIFQTLTDAGVYFNVVFRQGLGIFAAFCHIKAAEMSTIPKIKVINRIIVFSYLVGVLYVLMIGLTNA